MKTGRALVTGPWDLCLLNLSLNKAQPRAAAAGRARLARAPGDLGHLLSEPAAETGVPACQRRAGGKATAEKPSQAPRTGTGKQVPDGVAYTLRGRGCFFLFFVGKEKKKFVTEVVIRPP